MTIQIIQDNVDSRAKFHKFSDGASYIQFEPKESADTFVLTIVNEPADTIPWIIDTVNLILAQVKYEPQTKILHLPYFPFARADRSFEKGNANILEYFATSLSIGEWDEVVTNDVHNRAALEESLTSIFGTTKLVEKTQSECFYYTSRMLMFAELLPIKSLKYNKENVIFAAPDKGASHKTRELAAIYSVGYMQCAKERDVTTGWIKSFSIEEYFGACTVVGKDVIIVDDICDGGATFQILAKSLKELGARSVTLYVTHGIFAKGLEVFRPYVDYIMCYQTVMNYVIVDDIYNYNKGVK